MGKIVWTLEIHNSGNYQPDFCVKFKLSNRKLLLLLSLCKDILEQVILLHGTQQPSYDPLCSTYCYCIGSTQECSL